ncbi:ABC transporter ATP-binding protein [Catenovulum sediminis]|uniref:ABC transporter ATP-binding protein n=1 Tax=Catenovulum sediminis TaxID=1740262 RepID=UPI00163D64C4|nr:ABC transporter ATP-binding protein [Catenovulum sediminis]
MFQSINKCLKENALFFAISLQFKKEFVLLFIFSTSSMLAYLPSPLIIQRLIDNLEQGRFEDKNELYLQITILLVVMLGAIILGYFLAIYIAKVVKRYNSSIKTNIYKAVVYAKYQELSKISETDIQARATRDVDSIGYLTPVGLSTLSVELLKLIFLIGLLFYTNLYLTLSLLIMLPISFFIFKYFSAPLYNLSKNSHETFSDYNSKILEAFSSVRECQVDNSFEYHTQKVQERIDESEGAKFNWTIVNRKINVLMSSLPIIVSVLVWAIGGSKVIDSTMTLGEVMAYMIFLSMLYTPVAAFYNFMAEFHFDISAIERIEQILSISQIPLTVPGRLNQFTQQLEARDISLLYGEKQVLDQVNFSIKPGEVICIDGINGSGKTSFINILLGLISPDKGKLYLDDVELKLEDVQFFRESIGFVPQDVFIYNDSLINNITQGKTYSDDRIISVIEQVGLTDMYQNLETDQLLLLTPKTLSGGMKQKIGLARALIKLPGILILDEPTNHLDPETKQQIKNVICQSGDVSVIYISHDPDMQVAADRVLTLSLGKLTNG